MKTLKVIFFDLGETLVTKEKQLITGAKATLAALHQKGMRLGIISNTGNLKRAKVVKMLPADFDLGIFEEQLIIFSSEVGVEKPDLQIFRRLDRRLRLYQAERRAVLRFRSAG